MAKTIKCTSNSVCLVEGATLFSIGLELVDEKDEHIDAVFEIDTQQAEIPMVGITPYGMVIGQCTSGNSTLGVIIGATDDTEFTTVELSVSDLSETIAGTTLGEGGGK